MSESGQHRFESDPQPFATRVPLSLRHSSLYSIEYKQKKAKKNLSKTLKDLKKAKRPKTILKKVLSSFFKGSHINLRNSMCLCPLQAGPVRHPARLQRLDTNSNSSGSMEENNKIH